MLQARCDFGRVEGLRYSLSCWTLRFDNCISCILVLSYHGTLDGWGLKGLRWKEIWTWHVGWFGMLNKIGAIGFNQNSKNPGWTTTRLPENRQSSGSELTTKLYHANAMSTLTLDTESMESIFIRAVMRQLEYFTLSYLQLVLKSHFHHFLSINQCLSWQNTWSTAHFLWKKTRNQEQIPLEVCNAVLFSLPMALGLASASILSAFGHDDGSLTAPVTTGLCGESLLYAANGAAALCRAFRWGWKVRWDWDTPQKLNLCTVNL